MSPWASSVLSPTVSAFVKHRPWKYQWPQPCSSHSAFMAASIVASKHDGESAASVVPAGDEVHGGCAAA